MNKKSSKLLAAVAVFAAVFAVFAAVPVADATEKNYDSLMIDETHFIAFEDTLTATIVGDTVYFNGYTTAGYIPVVQSDMTFGGDFPYIKTLWASMAIGGFTQESDDKVNVVQNNSAIKEAYTGIEQAEEDPVLHVEEGMKDKDYTQVWKDTQYSFLVPKTSDLVTITFTWADGTVNTYKFNFSEVSTKIVLSDPFGTAGTDAVAYASNTLTFTNYTGKEIFSHSGNLTVSFSGTNVINAYSGPIEQTYANAHCDVAPAILASTSLTVKGTATTDSLTINQKSEIGFALASLSVTLGDTGASEKTTKIITTGGDRAVYSSQGKMTIDNAILNLKGSEKTVRVNGTLEITESTVTASIIETGYTNQLGDDDIFGIKTYALSVGTNSTVTTDGLRVTGGTFTNTGTIYVSGDYEQNSGANIYPVIAGLYVDKLDSDGVTSVNVIGSIPTTDSVGAYVIGDCEVFGGVSVINGSTTEKEVVSTVDAAAAEFTAGAEEVVVVPSAEIADGAISIPGGKTLTIVSGTYAVTQTFQIGTNADNVLKMSGVKGTFSISEGSVVAAGNFTAGNFNVTGDITLDGTFDDGTNGFTVTLTGSAATVTLGPDFKLTSGTTMTFVSTAADNKALKVQVLDGTSATMLGTSEIALQNTTMNIMGSVLGTNAEINADTKSYVYVNSGAIVTTKLAGDGEFYLDDAKKEVHIAKDIVSDFNATAQQIVYIDDSITIYKGATLNIAGELVIAEGMKVTVMDGGYLIVNGVKSNATIDGKLVVNGKDGFQFTGEELVVNGEVEVKSVSDSKPSMSVTGATEINGTVTVQNKSTATFGNVVVNEDATLTITGTASGAVSAYGTVVMNGTPSNFTVSLQVGGIVDVRSVTGTMTVNDNGMILKKNEVVGTGAKYTVNSVVLQNVRGVTVTGDMSSKTDDNGNKVYTNKVLLSGTALDVKDADGSIIIATGTVRVVDTLDLGKVDMTVTSTLRVEGTVLSTDKDADAISGAGTMTVTGLVKVIDSATVTKINAVNYQIKEGDITYEIYTNLKDAIASGVEDLNVLGDLEVLEDTVVPAGIAIDASSSKITVGSDELTAVTLTIEKDGELSAKTVDVKGTFVIEYKDNVTCSDIISDTSSIGEESAIYTNVYNALAAAQSGDVVKITNKSGFVILTKDAEIKDGVTLEVPNTKTLGILTGVTLTVTGTLFLNNGIIDAYELDSATSTYVTTGAAFGTKAIDGANKYAVVKVTGTIESYDELLHSEYKIAGAYYTIKNKEYITTVDKAVSIITTVDESTVNVHGDNTVGDITVIGTEDEQAILNIVDGKFTVGSLMVDDAKFDAKSGSVLNGTFGSAVGTVGLVNMVSYGFTIEDAIVDRAGTDVEVVYMAGALNGVSTEVVADASVRFNGTVTIEAALTINTNYFVKNITDGNYTDKDYKLGDLVVSDGATVSVIKDGVFTADQSAITGTGSATDNLYKAQEIQILGTLEAIDGGIVALNIATVIGTLTQGVADEDVSAGIVSVTDLYVGLGPEDVIETAGTATVNGMMTISDIMYVLNGSTIPADLVKDKDSIEFSVEDGLWMTVYNFGSSSSVTVTEVPIENVELVDWINEKGESATGWSGSGDSTCTITFSGNKTVEAKINYNIYTIVLIANEGVDDVFIDGNLMKYGTISAGNASNTGNITVYAFTASVAAGEHEITYTLKNGYTGEAALIVDGEKMTGMAFSTSGEADTYELQLSGIEKSGYTPEAEKSGMSLTEILLIVLVVLIAVMAIVIAMRMMRS